MTDGGKPKYWEKNLSHCYSVTDLACRPAGSRPNQGLGSKRLAADWAVRGWRLTVWVVRGWRLTFWVVRGWQLTVWALRGGQLTVWVVRGWQLMA